MDPFTFIWFGCIFGTIITVLMRDLSGWYVFWSLFLGPIGLGLALLATPKHDSYNSRPVSNLNDEITNLKLNVSNLQRRVARLEKDTSDPNVSKPIAPEIKPISPESITPLPVPDQKISETPGLNLPASEDFPINHDSIFMEPKKKQQAIHKYESAKFSHKNDNKSILSKEPSKAEINFGQFWLNKIGIVIFTLGIGFFISYSFKYFPPILKDAFGYAISGILFYLGRRFEGQKKMKHFGLALMGAGWALTYFTTYALHHFEASRIIGSQMLDMFLLFIVAIGMMMHSLKAKSETMMMISLGTAYVTSLIGTVTTFTFASSIVLGCVVVFLLYRFQWVKTLFMGMGITYLIHQFFIHPSFGSEQWFMSTRTFVEPLLNLYFLFAYWMLYFLGTHIVKGRDETEKNCIAAGNFVNFALFFVMSGPVFQDYFSASRVIALAGIGLVYLGSAVVMYIKQRRLLYTSDIVIATFAFALATFLKYLPHTSLMIWFVQVPFMLYVGLKYKDQILTYLSYILSGFCFFRFISVWFDSQSGMYSTSMMEMTALVGCVSMASCYWMARQQREAVDVEKIFKWMFCGTSVMYLNVYLCSEVDYAWTGLCLLVEVPILLYLGIKLKEDMLKYAGHILTWIAVLVCLPYLWDETFVNFLGLRTTNVQCTYFFGSIAMWGSYWINKTTARPNVEDPFVEIPGHIYSGLGALMMTGWLCSVAQGVWVTVALTVEAIVLFALGKVTGMDRLRVYCHAILLVVLSRFIGVDDYNRMGGALKWLTITFELASLFGLYFFAKEKDTKNSSDTLDELEANGIFLGYLVAYLWTVFNYAIWGWRSLSLGVGGVALILFGLTAQDKTSRVGGFVLLGISLGRIVLIDLAQLPTIFKIISFIIIGALLLGLSFMYNRNFAGDKIKDEPEQ